MQAPFRVRMGVAMAIVGALGMTGLAAGWIGAATGDSQESEQASIADQSTGRSGISAAAAIPAVEAKASEASIAPEESDTDLRWFNNRPIRPVRTVSMLVTAYSPDERSCGKWADGITASGYSVWTNGMKLVAADTSILPFGSLVSVPGYDGGDVVPVLDRGGKIKGNRLDVLYPTHEEALVWGVQRLEVTIWEYADGEPNGFRTNHRRR